MCFYLFIIIIIIITYIDWLQSGILMDDGSGFDLMELNYEKVQNLGLANEIDLNWERDDTHTKL